MRKVIKQLLGILCFIWIAHSAWADEFVVRQIKVTGLQRVPQKTVLNYVPVVIGQKITTQDTINILNSLYKTGFFSDVRLARQSNTLIITVKEQPTIGLIQIRGNKEFTDKQLMPVLKDLGVAEGQPYDHAKINSIVQGLRDQYNQLGYYAVSVRAEEKPEPRNRVALYINIKEGPIAKIHKIVIQGNHAYKESQLKKIFTSRTTAWWKLTFLSHNDRYSKIQLAKDLEQLRNFYYNRGYLRFQIVDQKTIISPDNKSVDIIIQVSEGPQYKIKDYEIKGLSRQTEDLHTLQTYLDPAFKPGAIFAKQTMINGAESIRVYFASKGHAFPVINTDPQLDDALRQVYIVYTVNPGPVSYVRFVDFTGNTRTSDTALRNRVSQMEGAPYSMVNVQQSKARLAYLPYLDDVSVDTNPVPDIPDQVDLAYHVKEVNAGKASIQGGYSTSEGIIYGASLSEPNLFGTGKYGSLNFNASEFQKSYSFTYVNPFYTTYGVSRSLTLFSTITTPSTDLNQASYSMDGYGGTLLYGIPVSLNSRLNLGYGYTYIVLHDVDGAETSPTVKDFVHDHPDPYNQFKGILSWSYSTLDRAVAPTRGFSELIGLELGFPVVSSSLSYYKITQEMKYFYPLGHGFIVEPNFSFGFGNGYGNLDTLPFFNNFYAGGIESIPGYAPNSLGPQNPNQLNASLGGNFRIIAGTNLIIPNGTKKIRTAAIFNAGNVFDTNKVDSGDGPGQVQYENVSLKNIRMSAGVMIIWYSPMGPLQFSLAQAINAKSKDQLKFFDFAFGASI